MTIESYLLRLALRRDFVRLQKELTNNYYRGEQQRLFSRISDIEIAVLTLQTIIEDDEDFKRYGLAVEILNVLVNHVNGLDQRLEKLFDHVRYYTKMLHLLSTIGRQATNGVTELMSDYFPNMEHSEDFAQNVSRSVYMELRQFILRVLLNGKCSERFAEEKFPTDYVAVHGQLRKIFSKLLKTLYVGFQPTELSKPFDQLSKKAQSDPGVILFYDTFKKRGGSNRCVFPSEDDLLEFVGQIRCSQLSIPPPKGLILPTPNAIGTEELRSDYSSILINTAKHRRALATLFHKSAKLLASSFCDNINARLSVSDSETSYQSGFDDGLRLTTGSDDLFASRPSKRCRFDSSQFNLQEEEMELSIDYGDWGIKKIYDLDGNLKTLRPSDLHCVVRIEPIDWKKISVSIISDYQVDRTNEVTTIE